MPEIIIVIPIFNAVSFLSKTINSVLNHTFSDFELILEDDGSTDNRIGIIHSYNDPRIKLFPCQHDFTDIVNREYGESNGKYIVQLDQDDLMIPERLQIQYEFMENNLGISGSGVWMQCFDKRTHVISIPTHEQILFNILKPQTVKINTSLLAVIILNLLQNPTESKQLGKNRRKRYLDKYSSIVFRDNMLQMYQ